jgi:hypothetical protein
MEIYPFLFPGKDKPSPLPYAPSAPGRFALVAFPLVRSDNALRLSLLFTRRSIDTSCQESMAKLLRNDVRSRNVSRETLVAQKANGSDHNW